MILVLMSFSLIGIFMYSPKIFVYSLMVFFVMFDMLDGFYDDDKVYAAMRYLIPFILLMIFAVRKKAFKKSDLIFLILVLYMVILMVYSTDMLVSGKNLLAVIITFLMIPVGRCIGRTSNMLEEFEPYNRFMLIILCIYIFMANIFHFGESYTEAFTTGFLVTSRMYIFPIVVFLALHYIITNKNRTTFIKTVDIVFIVLSISIMLINTRRTALGMLFLAIVVYAVVNPRLIFKMVVLTFFFICTLVVAYPLYQEPLNAQLEKRDRIQDLDTYEEEGRVLETLYIMDYHSKEQNIFKILFGVKLFDTFDFGTKYFGRDRPIHSDINMIFFSTGLVGLFLFAYFFVHYFYFGNKKMAPEARKVYYPILIMFLVVLPPGRFISTFTYAPFLMFLLGGIKSFVPVQFFYIEEDESETEDEIEPTYLNT